MKSQQFCKLVGVALLASCGCAFAQYGNGTGTGTTGATTGGTYTPGSRSYGHGALIGGIAGGAAGAGILYYALHHRHAAVVGCVAPDGKTLTADKGKHTYELTGAPVTAGNHVSVVGKKSKGSSGIDELDVTAVKKDMGQCHQASSATASGMF